MIPISFDKSKAESYLKSLDTGAPIECPSPNGWTTNDLLALAGACFFGAMSHLLGMRSEGHAEHREADEAMIFEGLHRAIEFYSNLTMKVCDGEYELERDAFDAVLKIEDGKSKIIMLPEKPK